MDARLYANDFNAAMRAAKGLGKAEIALVKARAAAKTGARNARALLDKDKASIAYRIARDAALPVFRRRDWTPIGAAAIAFTSIKSELWILV